MNTKVPTSTWKDFFDQQKGKHIDSMVRSALVSVDTSTALIESATDGIGRMKKYASHRICSDIISGLEGAAPCLSLLRYEWAENGETLLQVLVENSFDHNKKRILPSISEVFEDHFFKVTGHSTIAGVHDATAKFNQTFLGKYQLLSKRILPAKKTELQKAAQTKDSPPGNDRAMIRFCLSMK